MLEFFGSAGSGPASGRGCLLCNTAVEFGPKDPGGKDFVQHYFARLSNAFCSALDNARDGGVIARKVDTGSEAAFFTSSVLGLFVMIRAKAPAHTIDAAARVAIEHLDSLEKTS